MIDYKQFEKFRQTVSCADENKSLNWLIVVPRLTRLNDQQYLFPIGMAYVASALKASGRNVFTLNLNYKEEECAELLTKTIKQNNIHILATGGLSSQYSLLYEIFQITKQIDPKIITVAGGGIITSAPDLAMDALEYVNYGIIGEGEITICELAYALETNSSVSNVKGLILKSNENWITTPSREEIIDLDMLPWPDYDSLEYAETLSKTPIDVLTAINDNERLGISTFSRSCPYNCTFCFHSSGKKYRSRSINSFFKELEWMINKYALTSIYLVDECFLSDIAFVREFCQRMKQHGIRWQCSSRVDNITREMLELLINAGCDRINFGVESANNHILKSMRKNITREQIESAFSLCQEMGIAAKGGLIFGDLEETIETAIDSINWRKLHQDWAITMHWIIAYPGSHIYNVACERGIISDPLQHLKNGCPEVNFSKMTDAERQEIVSILGTYINDSHEVLSNASLKQGQSGKVTVTGDCPYCGKTGTFLNIDTFKPIKLEVCQVCRKTLHLYGFDYVDSGIFSDNIKTLLVSNKIALWPVVAGIVKLFELSKELQNDNVYLVDSSQYKQGMSLCGKKVYAPDIISDEDISIVILTTTTYISSAIIDRINTNFPNVAIKTVGQLFFPQERRT